ncbi:homoserine kinase [Magnetococcus marinus MC-1]|uniref:Homoserine kinase n=1 Tax=Magnetococcus marinus (strain ATCC BAA-1437 / JCM 17883 / MC-1) TaxID=156889 RepID=A0L5V0_MAGMM|nr:homoserine kinase [Magnetococcus marinus]ABK43343.1 homoserine kinase [Magnetococcus marinus MC-1]
MSVYTTLTLAELGPFLARHDIGQPLSLEGISAGVVNTNYRLTTSRGIYILTLIESGERDYLPWMLALLAHYRERGVPCPLPIADNRRQMLHTLKNRPAILVSFLDGELPNPLTPGHAWQAGRLLARLHHGAQSFDYPRENPLGPVAWRSILAQLTPMLQEDVTTLELLQKTLIESETVLFCHKTLPSGIGHADLFPDNTLFDGEVLTGAIDFHYACTLPWIYDLAISLCAWGFDEEGAPRPKMMSELWRGYAEARPIDPDELQIVPVAMRAAALRFSLTRLRDFHFPRQGLQVTRKNPAAFLRLLHWLWENPSIIKQLGHP